MTVLPDRDLLEYCGLLLPGFQQGCPQGHNQTFARHFQEIVRGFAGRNLKVGPGVAADMNDIQGVIDDNAGWRILGQQHPLGCSLHIERNPCLASCRRRNALPGFSKFAGPNVEIQRN